MKRLHIHVAVEDLTRSIGFYSTLFGAEPSVLKDDYAKWILEDPRVNFAISDRARAPGLDHLGIQVDSQEDLAALRGNAAKADMAVLDEGETSCCYARSEKYWVTDPQGVAWEQFHTLESIPVFSEKPAAGKSACCAATSAAEPAKAACC